MLYFCLQYTLRSSIDTDITYLTLEDSELPLSPPLLPIPPHIHTHTNCKVTSDPGGFIWGTDFEMQNIMEEVYWGIFSR